MIVRVAVCTKIPDELLEEMKGFAKGLTRAGFPSSLNDIIGWNAYPEMGYWWAAYGKEAYIRDGLAYTGMPANNYGALITGQGTKHYPGRHGHCSAFIATGSATRDNKIVIGHETFDDFWNAGVANVILDMKPSEGARILMQTAPGYVWSNTDFFICKSEEKKIMYCWSGNNDY
ncbi:MAG: hypothetical protein ACC630_03405 [Nitrospinota bacterium]